LIPRRRSGRRLRIISSRPAFVAWWLRVRTPYLSCRVFASFASFAVERQSPVLRPPSSVLRSPYYYFSESRSRAKILEAARCKSRKPKELCLAPRRQDRKGEQHCHPVFLAFFASHSTALRAGLAREQVRPGMRTSPFCLLCGLGGLARGNLGSGRRPGWVHLRFHFFGVPGRPLRVQIQKASA
jgi:hypothetical protein